MSRKRIQEEDSQDNGMYLLPGCYTTCSCSQQDDNQYYNYLAPILTEDHTFTGDSLYVVDPYGNVFYSSCAVSYVCCENIVRCADAQMKIDDLSDSEADRENKKTRFALSTDDEETASGLKNEFPAYTVEEPPDEDDGLAET